MLDQLIVGHTGQSEHAAQLRQQAMASHCESGVRVPRYGVVLFDNPRDMTAGWACRSQDRAFRISSVAELSNDSVWVTNLSFTEYLDRAKKMPHLRRADFLRSGLPAIAQDLGVRIEGAYAAESISMLASLVQRTVELAVRCYDLRDPANDLRADVLPDDINRIVARVPKVDETLRSALTGAYQSYSSPAWPQEYDDQKVMITLRHPRVAHAKRVMSHPVPDEAWTSVPRQEVARMSLDSLLDPQYPVLVEAAVELGSIDPEIATLVAFGAGSGGRVGLRKWISQPELAWLSRYARLSINSVLRAKSARLLPQSVELPPLIANDPLMEVSLSAGLVAECHWSAVSQSQYNRKLKAEEFSTWSVWLKAVDRALMFESALKMHKLGYRVIGYGNGSLHFWCQRQNLRQCLQHAEDMGFAHPVFESLFERHGLGG